MRAPSGAPGQLLAVRPVTVPVLVPDAGSAQTRRRAVGLLVLTLAVIASLVGPHLFGIGHPGHATASPAPPAPPVGSCLQIADDDSATVVGCDEPHTGELAMTWGAGVPPVAAAGLVRYPHFSVTRSISNPDVDTRCIGWAERYTGWDRYLTAHDADLWLAPQPLAVGRMVRAAVDRSVAHRAWTGCAVVTTDPTYVGSIRDTAFAPRTSVAGVRPDAVSVCLNTSDTGLRFLSCGEPHNTEMIGSVNLTQQMMADRTVTRDHTAEEVAARCLALAADRMGTEPTFGGRLAVVAESVWQQSLRDQKPTTSAWLIPDCLVRVVGDGLLTHSLVEQGDRPLPLTP